MDIAVQYSRGGTEAASRGWQQEDCLVNICNKNNNKTILSNDNNNNSWTGCLIISTTMLLFLYVPGIRMSA